MIELIGFAVLVFLVVGGIILADGYEPKPKINPVLSARNFNMICGACGKENPYKSQWCMECGINIDDYQFEPSRDAPSSGGVYNEG